MQCFKCQRYGHFSSSCPNTDMCVCGRAPHEESCPDPKICVNCGLEHSARYRNCSKYKEEMNIQRTKTLENISYIEAKRKVISQIRPLSYAQATTSQKETVKTAINDLLPLIRTSIEEQLKKIMPLSDPTILPNRSPFQTPQIRREQNVSAVSDASTTFSEKRKRGKNTRPINYREDELDSDSSHTSTGTDQRKKKKGWPKGKARKPRLDEGSRDNNTDQTPTQQVTE
nr:unnamed protein product [Callosobruchus chinensis]